MSAAPQFRLKKPTGWFAAGHEVDDALSLLSDGAFRLFMWLCLHADRSRGSIRAGTSGLVRTTGRSQEQIVSALGELVRKRICILYIDDVIEIADRFWPYRRAAIAALVAGRASHVGRVRRIFMERRCVQSTFTHADEQFAAELNEMGVPVYARAGNNGWRRATAQRRAPPERLRPTALWRSAAIAGTDRTVGRRCRHTHLSECGSECCFWPLDDLGNGCPKVAHRRNAPGVHRLQISVGAWRALQPHRPQSVAAIGIFSGTRLAWWGCQRFLCRMIRIALLIHPLCGDGFELWIPRGRRFRSCAA